MTAFLPPQKPDGAVDEWMSRVLGKSWKTTLAGLLVAVAGVAAVVPGTPPVVRDVAQVLLPIFAGGGLIAAKDKGVTGGKREA